MKSCPLIFFNSASASTLFSISPFTASFLVLSLRAFSTSVTDESLTRRCSVSASALDSTPAVLEILSPPPLIMRVVSPDPWPPLIETRIGF